MKLYRLKKEWAHEATLLDAFVHQLEWEHNIATRQGAMGVKRSRIPEIFCAMLEEVQLPTTPSPPERRGGKSQSQSPTSE